MSRNWIRNYCLQKYHNFLWASMCLTHWSWVTHICVSKLTINDSDNGFSPYRRQAIIWANAGILLIGPLGTNFSEILIEIYAFSFKKMHFKMSGKWRPSCLSLNVLTAIMLWHSSYKPTGNDSCRCPTTKHQAINSHHAGWTFTMMEHDSYHVNRHRAAVVNSLWPSDTIGQHRSWVNIGSGNGLLPDNTINRAL